MTAEDRYNMPPKGLFGKRCRIKHCGHLMWVSENVNVRVVGAELHVGLYE